MFIHTGSCYFYLTRFICIQVYVISFSYIFADTGSCYFFLTHFYTYMFMLFLCIYFHVFFQSNTFYSYRFMLFSFFHIFYTYKCILFQSYTFLYITHTSSCHFIFYTFFIQVQFTSTVYQGTLCLWVIRPRF